MNFDSLREWGWNESTEEAFEALGAPHLEPARILSQREDTFTLVTAGGLRWAHPAGALFHKNSSQERPAVGDWVAIEEIDCPVTEEESSVTVTHSVVEVLPRTSCFLREAPGGRGEAQVVATNVDTVFIVNPADDLNCNRIERLAVAICSGGSHPALIISKGDLVNDEEVEDAVSRVSQLMEGMPILTSENAPSRARDVKESLEPHLEKGKTYALVGASGVGKSTLINALLGESVQETGEVREGDHKGRHVTSFRELFQLPGGALMMDTPGIREFALWSQGGGVEMVFKDLEELACRCRFSDCAHKTEPGCAVLEGLAEGVVSERRMDNWRALKEELESSEERRDRREARRERAQFRRKVKRDKRFSRR